MNLANLRAAKTVSIRPSQDHMPKPEAVKIFFITMPGSTPKLTISARESSSLPMGDETFKSLAENPSKKSKKAPK